MAVVNIAFDLAPDILEGLAIGKYKLFGGVVRDQAGRIVQHLPEALKIAEASQQAAVKVASTTTQTATKAIAKSSVAKNAVSVTAHKAPSLFKTIGLFAKAHPVGTTIGGLAVLAGVGYGIYKWVEYKKAKNAEIEATPAYIDHFNVAMDAYYSAIQDGSLNEKIVSDLITAIDDMKAAIGAGTVKMEFTADQISNMLGILTYFTREFARANHFDYTEPEAPTGKDSCSNLTYFEDYLKIQQSIYRAA